MSSMSRRRLEHGSGWTRHGRCFAARCARSAVCRRKFAYGQEAPMVCANSDLARRRQRQSVGGGGRIPASAHRFTARAESITSNKQADMGRTIGLGATVEGRRRGCQDECALRRLRQCESLASILHPLPPRRQGCRCVRLPVASSHAAMPTRLLVNLYRSDAD